MGAKYEHTSSMRKRLNNETWQEFEIDGLPWEVLGKRQVDVWPPLEEEEEIGEAQGIEEALIAYVKGW